MSTCPGQVDDPQRVRRHTGLTETLETARVQTALSSGGARLINTRQRNRAGSRSPCAAALKMRSAKSVRLTPACCAGVKLVQAVSRTALISSIVSGSKLPLRFSFMTAFSEIPPLMEQKLTLAPPVVCQLVDTI